jgi:hypothetical protein
MLCGFDLFVYGLPTPKIRSTTSCLNFPLKLLALPLIRRLLDGSPGSLRI